VKGQVPDTQEARGKVLPRVKKNRGRGKKKLVKIQTVTPRGGEKEGMVKTGGATTMTRSLLGGGKRSAVAIVPRSIHHQPGKTKRERKKKKRGPQY